MPDPYRALREGLTADLRELGQLRARRDAVLADLEHVRDRHGTTHHDGCWDEHIGCLAARVARTLRGEIDG